MAVRTAGESLLLFFNVNNRRQATIQAGLRFHAEKFLKIRVNRLPHAALLQVKHHPITFSGETNMKWTMAIGSGVLAAMMAFNAQAADEETTPLQTQEQDKTMEQTMTQTRTQTREQAMEQKQEASGEMSQTQTMTKTQEQTQSREQKRENDGMGSQNRYQHQNQNRTMSGTMGGGARH